MLYDDLVVHWCMHDAWAGQWHASGPAESSRMAVVGAW